MAEPPRIRRVEAEYDNPRPRDAALRRERDREPARKTNVTYRPINENNLTIDQQFTDTYAESGLQPSVGYRPPVRTVAVDYKNQPDDEVGGRETTFREGPSREKRSKDQPNARRGVIERGTNIVQKTSRSTFRPRGGTLKTVSNSLQGTRTATLYRRSFRVNLQIIIWGGQAWFWVQLPFALLSLIFIGIAIGIETAQQQIKQIPVIGSAAYAIFEFFSKSLNALLKTLTPFSLDGLDPMTFALLCHFLAFFVGVATLLTMAIIYQMTFLRGFMGNGSTVKISAFIIAMVFYTFPLLNIFPGALFWALAVMRYPK